MLPSCELFCLINIIQWQILFVVWSSKLPTYPEHFLREGHSALEIRKLPSWIFTTLGGLCASKECCSQCNNSFLAIFLTKPCLRWLRACWCQPLQPQDLSCPLPILSPQGSIVLEAFLLPGCHSPGTGSFLPLTRAGQPFFSIRAAQWPVGASHTHILPLLYSSVTAFA